MGGAPSSAAAPERRRDEDAIPEKVRNGTARAGTPRVSEGAGRATPPFFNADPSFLPPTSLKMKKVSKVPLHPPSPRRRPASSWFACTSAQAGSCVRTDEEDLRPGRAAAMLSVETFMPRGRESNNAADSPSSPGNESSGMLATFARRRSVLKAPTEVRSRRQRPYSNKLIPVTPTTTHDPPPCLPPRDPM